VNPDRIRALLRFLMDQACQLDPDRRWAEVSLTVLDDPAITQLKGQWFDRFVTTDVITFTSPPVVKSSGWTGEILVNAPQAVREGGRRKTGVQFELALYIAHGCDHLMDQSDRTAAGRKRMRQRECEWLRLAEKAGWVRGLIGI